MLNAFNSQLHRDQDRLVIRRVKLPLQVHPPHLLARNLNRHPKTGTTHQKRLAPHRRNLARKTARSPPTTLRRKLPPRTPTALPRSRTTPQSRSRRSPNHPPRRLVFLLRSRLTTLPRRSTIPRKKPQKRSIIPRRIPQRRSAIP